MLIIRRGSEQASYLLLGRLDLRFNRYNFNQSKKKDIFKIKIQTFLKKIITLLDTGNNE